MNDWMEPFLEECLAKVPGSPYREQVKSELTDHLETAAKALEEAGYGPREARELALGQMGDPSALSDRFREEFLRRQPRDAGHCVVVFLGSCFIAGGLYFFAFLIMSILLGYHLLEPVLPMGWVDGLPHELADGLLRGLYGCGMFLLPFGLTARFLTQAFFYDRRRTLMVTWGLLVVWLGEKAAIVLLSACVYGQWDIPAILTRIACGGDYLAPWFTLPYILLTLAGCPLLALMVSRRERRAVLRRARRRG